jgi:hypothetical protein
MRRRVSVLRLYLAVIVSALLFLTYQLFRRSKDIITLAADFRWNDAAVIRDYLIFPTSRHHGGSSSRPQKRRRNKRRRRHGESVPNDALVAAGAGIQRSDPQWLHHEMREFANRSKMIDYASRSFPKWNGSKNGWCVMNGQEQQPQQQQQWNRPLALQDLKRLHGQQQPHLHRLSPLILRQEPHLAASAAASASPNPQGLMFSKTFKTGSSTATSVSLQIAHQVARREQRSLLLSMQDASNTSRGRRIHSSKSIPKCRVHMTHEVSLENRLFSHRNATSSLLWTIVRNPVPRAISAFYFYKVGMDQVEPSDENIIAYLQGTRHQQAIQLRLDRPSIKEEDGILIHDKNNDKQQQRRLVDDPMPDFVADLETNIHPSRVGYYKSQVPEIIRREIMNRFDFVAVQDRLDESLVVFKLLLDLDDGDIIVLSSKRTGTYSWNWKKRLPVKECFQIPTVRPLSPAVLDYLQTNYTWQNNADFLLHAVANQSLDWTIDHVVPGGRTVVEQHVQRHRQLQSLVQERCQHKAIFPCAGDGHYQEASTHDCYFRDMGCGYRCIDNVLDLYRQGKLEILPS